MGEAKVHAAADFSSIGLDPLAAALEGGRFWRSLRQLGRARARRLPATSGPGGFRCRGTATSRRASCCAARIARRPTRQRPCLGRWQPTTTLSLLVLNVMSSGLTVRQRTSWRRATGWRRRGSCRPLRLVERAVGALDHVAHAAERSDSRHTDADRHAQAGQRAIGRVVAVNALPDALGDRGGAVETAARHHHRELLAAVARADVEDAHRAPQDVGDVLDAPCRRPGGRTCR